MLQLQAARAAVLQAHAVELPAAHDIDIHLRSSSTTDTGTCLQEENVFEANEATGLAHRHQETLYIRDDLGSVSVVGAGIGRRPDMTDGALPPPSRVMCHNPARHVNRPADADSRLHSVGHR
jgi:aspartate kinase